MLLQFALFRGATDCEEVTVHSLGYADNRKMIDSSTKNHVSSKTKNNLQKQLSVDARIDELCREVETFHLMMFM